MLVNESTIRLKIINAGPVFNFASFNSESAVLIHSTLPLYAYGVTVYREIPVKLGLFLNKGFKTFNEQRGTNKNINIHSEIFR